MLTRLLGSIALITLIGAIFIGGTSPGAGSLFPPPWDKLVHTLTYGIMFLCAKASFPNTKLSIIFLLIVVIGATDEIHQIYIPGRSAGIDDFIADILGAGVGLLTLNLKSYISRYKSKLKL